MRWLAVLIATGCASHTRPIMEMSTGCLGKCAQYVVTVHEDGSVDHRGDARVRNRRLAPAQLAELDEMFARFSSIDRRELQCEQTDLGTLYTITYRGENLSFFDLCPNVTGDLLVLVGGIRLLLGIEGE